MLIIFNNDSTHMSYPYRCNGSGSVRMKIKMRGKETEKTGIESARKQMRYQQTMSQLQNAI